MVYSDVEVVEMLSEQLKELHEENNWEGEIEIDITINKFNDKSAYIINLEKFTLFGNLLEKYIKHGYDDFVVVNFLHSLISEKIQKNYFMWFCENPMINYFSTKMGTHIREIDKKSIKYRLDLIKK